MNKHTSIQLKAAFLLVVFVMNTLVGFACSMSVDMDFNTPHQDNNDVPSVHVHANGQKHEHPPKPHTHHQSATGKHVHTAGHQHAGAATTAELPAKEKDGCCSGKVTALAQADKAVPQPLKIISPVFFTAFAFVYFNETVLFPTIISTDNKYFVRSHHPPPDVRIAMQLFQI